ncbi:MAG: hypothetical protein JWN70_4718 [Planctomycetaceae bacterium]|nr:hypothetical protein [Planctomycetaceae bacterium]
MLISGAITISFIVQDAQAPDGKSNAYSPFELFGVFLFVCGCLLVRKQPKSNETENTESPSIK